MKRIHKTVPTFLLVLCFALSLFGCQNGQAETSVYNLIPETPTPSGRTASPSGGTTVPPEATQSLTYELTPERELTIAQGKLIFTLTGARAVTRTQDLPEGQFTRSNIVNVYDDNGNWADRGDDFVQEDGSFVDGVCVVLLDVTVESQDFLYKTADQNGGGPYYDPYLYGVQLFFHVKDLDERAIAEGIHNNNYSAGFYSGFGEEVNEEDMERYESYNLSAYELAIRLEPGEIKSFTVGYIIGNYSDGSSRNLETLCAIPLWISDKTPINLGLKNP